MGNHIRHDIVIASAGQLRYEIREIVAFANKLKALGIDITWENIGDPVNKGESIPPWIKDIIGDLVSRDNTWAYTATQGYSKARAFLAAQTNARGGIQISADDIIFFNGLGDAVARLFGSMNREARVIGPSPAYSTHSSAEAAHSGYDHLTYRLLPEQNWAPDMEEMENKVKYNDTIAGILVINPGNPTGVVYSREIMERIVRIADQYGLMVIADEIYSNITYNGARKNMLADVIGEVPGVSLQGISKEYPWPGGRCGWIEVYNQHADKSFERYIASIIQAKMLEVCSTSLPQHSIPRVMGDPRYPQHLENRRRMFEARTNEAVDILNAVDGIFVNRPQGAFYMTVVFEDGRLNDRQYLKIDNARIRAVVEPAVRNVALDKRFVYYLLGATGICVVPLTGFCCDSYGFRITSLECDDDKRVETWHRISKAILDYLASA